jgi:hypothetical protein
MWRHKTSGRFPLLLFGFRLLPPLAVFKGREFWWLPERKLVRLNVFLCSDLLCCFFGSVVDWENGGWKTSSAASLLLVVAS